MQFKQFVENAEWFIKNIIENWPDTSPMLVYADWLEEQGQDSEIYRDAATGKKTFIIEEDGLTFDGLTFSKLYVDIYSFSFQEVIDLAKTARVRASNYYKIKHDFAKFSDTLPTKMQDNPAVLRKWNERPFGAAFAIMYNIFYKNEPLPTEFKQILKALS